MRYQSGIGRRTLPNGGQAEAAAGELQALLGFVWVSSRGIGADHEDRAGTATSRNIPCPADDEFIGRLAAR